MQQKLSKSDLMRLKHKLRRVRVASWTAIEQGDCRAVARLTCETARLQETIDMVERIAV